MMYSPVSCSLVFPVFDKFYRLHNQPATIPPPTDSVAQLINIASLEAAEHTLLALPIFGAIEQRVHIHPGS
jgi:hypothetical protein